MIFLQEFFSALSATTVCHLSPAKISGHFYIKMTEDKLPAYILFSDDQEILENIAARIAKILAFYENYVLSAPTVQFYDKKNFQQNYLLCLAASDINQVCYKLKLNVDNEKINSELKNSASAFDKVRISYVKGHVSVRNCKNYHSLLRTKNFFVADSKKSNDLKNNLLNKCTDVFKTRCF